MRQQYDVQFHNAAAGMTLLTSVQLRFSGCTAMKASEDPVVMHVEKPDCFVRHHITSWSVDAVAPIWVAMND